VHLDVNVLNESDSYDAFGCLAQGRYAEAEQQMRLALRLDPKSPILRSNLGWIHYTARNYPLALSEIAQVVNEKPEFLTAHHKRWYIYSAQHDQSRAWQEFEWIADAGYEPLKDSTLAAYRKRGYSAALKVFAENPELSSESMVDRARFPVCAGDNHAALSSLALPTRQ
jgi:tetratricopeptide (TPR) repeat protein